MPQNSSPILHVPLKYRCGILVRVMARNVLRRPSPEPAVSQVAALIAEPARAAILAALVDGRELPASELAYRAGVAANAASAHFSRLLAGGLVRVRAEGRRRFFRLAGEDVAHVLEALTAIAPPAKIVALTQSSIATELRAARTCYDHLAGRLGVAVTDALVERRIITPAPERAYRLAANGDRFFAALGVELESLKRARRHFARQCIDWSERRPHLSGALGAAIYSACRDKGFIVHRKDSRAVSVSSQGREWLSSELSIELEH